MTKESKQKYLQAIDLLQSISTGRQHAANPSTHNGKGGGGYLACDVCNGPLYEANQHSPECPVGNMLKAANMPAFADREQWINDDTQPNITFTKPVQPEI
jgi:hypothetical protein